jgi:hypothetical protein
MACLARIGCVKLADISDAAWVANHGVTFEMARDVFKDAFAIEWLGSGLIDYSQKMTMAAMQIADMNV